MTTKIKIIFEDQDGNPIAERDVNFEYVVDASILEFRGRFYIYNQAKQGGSRFATFTQVDDPVEIT